MLEVRLFVLDEQRQPLVAQPGRLGQGNPQERRHPGERQLGRQQADAESGRCVVPQVVGPIDQAGDQESRQHHRRHARQTPGQAQQPLARAQPGEFLQQDRRHLRHTI